jgi:hypothetical protein
MYRSNIFKLSLILFVLNIYCSENEGPEIKLGKVFNKEKIEVSEQTNTFKRNDNFAYTLSQSEPFNTEIITRRFYKGKEYIDLIQKESTDINIKPDTKKIGESIPVEKLVQKYGGGNYMLLFIINDENYMLLFIINDYVIAKKEFTIDEKIFKTAGIENDPIKKELMQIKAEKAIQAAESTSTVNIPVKKAAENNELYDRLIPKKPERNIPMNPSEMMK